MLRNSNVVFVLNWKYTYTVFMRSITRFDTLCENIFPSRANFLFNMQLLYWKLQGLPGIVY